MSMIVLFTRDSQLVLFSIESGADNANIERIFIDLWTSARILIIISKEFSLFRSIP